MTLQLLHSEFPYKQYEENLIFFISVDQAITWPENQKRTLLFVEKNPILHTVGGMITRQKFENATVQYC
jgi:hypothetical protein